MTNCDCRCGTDSDLIIYHLGARYPDIPICFLECPTCGCRTSEHKEVSCAVKEWNKMQKGRRKCVSGH